MIGRSKLKVSPLRYFHFALVAAGIVFAVILAGVLWVSDPQTKQVVTDLASPLLNIVATICLTAAAWQSFRRSKKLGWAWTVLACGQLAFTVGDIFWAILEVGMSQAPFPSIADAFYLAYYPLFVAGVFLFPAKTDSARDWLKRLIDIGIVMLASSLIFWNFLIGPQLLRGAEESDLVTFLNLAYPVGDLIMLWALLVLLYNRAGRGLRAPLWFLVGAAAVQIFSDYAFTYQNLVGTYTSGGLLDLGWILAYLFTALAGLSQAVLIQAGEQAENQLYADLRFFRKFPNLLPFFPYVWMCGAFALLIFDHSNPLPMDFETLSAGVTVIIGLLIFRQVLTLAENRHLNDQLQGTLKELQKKADELSLANRDLGAEIAERKNVEEQLAHDALHDGLTGLANRVLFMDRLSQAITYTRRRTDYSFSVVFLDLDYFKVINDSLGHGLGDQLLMALALRLQNCLRSSDTVARLGGDEFVILLENTTNEQTVLVTANRILEELAIPFHLEGHEVYATVSMGVVPNLLGYDRADDVLRDADIAMYRAKEQGKSRFEIFNAGMRLQAMARLQLENELRHGIDEHEFQIYFQPIFALETLKVIGFEALLRWNHPSRGLLRPDEFIQVVEEAGFIHSLGQWILRESCTQLHTWHKLFPNQRHLGINVNISGKQITQPNFIDQIQQILAEVDLNPAALNLEITESTFMIDSATTSGFFSKLSRLGVRFQIDDFGTGYSSLSYLQRFPIQIIKIDRSFIHKMGKDGKSHELIRAIISMARDLGMNTTAEGIETQAQLNEMRKLGCTHGQGILLGQPMPAEDVVRLLSRIDGPAGEVEPLPSPAGI